MSAGQFWEEDPWLAEAYRKANDLNRQRVSFEAWLQGVYIFEAVSTAIGNAFRKKGTPPHSYREEPIRLIPLTESEKAAKAEKERQRAIACIKKLAKKWEEALKKKQNSKNDH